MEVEIRGLVTGQIHSYRVGQWRRARSARWVALLAAAAALVSGCALLGGNPDLSGWTARPTTPDPEFAAVARASCESFDHMTFGGPDPTDGAEGYAERIDGARLVQDQRGPNGALLLWVKPEGSVSSSAVRTDRGDVVSGNCGYSSGGSDGDNRFVIDEWGTGGPMSTVHGWAPRPIERVEVTTESGLVLDATVGEHQFIAWWPGDDAAASARAFDADGNEIGRAPRPRSPDETLEASD